MDTPWNDLARPPLRSAALRRALVGPGPWSRLDVVASTGSTNADLLADEDAPDGAVLVADHQTGGRGRLGRTWSAPPRSGLAVSVLLRPQRPAAEWSLLPLVTGLAAVDALEALGVRTRLKWPNDVLVEGPDRPGKVCGILAEARTGAGGARVVLGAGINVSLRTEELPVDTATSLALAGARSCDRDTVLRRYLRALRARVDAWGAGESPLGDYRALSATIGQDVRAHLPDGSVLEALAVDVDEEGRLVVEGSGGARTSLSAADVVHLRRR
ncbi:BirA family biotin operon repressor/biotin-[acetyl-CoA-carboxylase] ligase [Kineococcus radiotolerans]|uniref:biotin--[biotin carboxyl-carrier protein] ligase n=1 Tax=Kineococcus radiotolerans TaxID=131568 RepID=A0A7W4TPC7_KINRA|nr:biotin--[acetyl-CoA-carboxylase] ligase [Kineococcus radiotolerans]MBB2902248.1 BirA family biotin operon repressor/biotin-[acetyl-CoA-carboxylase] ligase [Kineococcus radiotolerans]